MRISRVLAVARRDLSLELRGRNGWVLPMVMAALLIPSSSMPSPSDLVMTARRNRPVAVAGDVPEAVAELPSVTVSRRANLVFRQTDDMLVVAAPEVPTAIREVLDGPNPKVTLEVERTGFKFPGRSLLFALISASTLTGAVATSIGGERSAHTLVVLLSAAVSRWELVAGKWLAWGGVGAATALGAALLAVALGNIEPGSWLLPLPLVPLATVAFGLWLVRRAGDVIAGTTTSLRVLPALLAPSGIVAWFLGTYDPHLGALVPVGGAMMAAGDCWEPASAVVLASVVTLLFCAFCVVGTAHDLEEVPNREMPEQRTTIAVALGSLAAGVWWLPLLVPLLWAEAGNPGLTEELPLSSGLWAGGLGLLAFSVVRGGRTEDAVTALGIGRPRVAPMLLWGLLGGLTLTTVGLVLGQVVPPEGTFGGSVAARLGSAIQPMGAPGALLCIIVADEVLFRGWLPSLVGHTRAAVVYGVVKAPLDPVGAVLMAGTLGVVGHRGGVYAALMARLLWAAALAALPLTL
ncbi:MAG: ABC transporter permease subunit [Myxococcales bacterium]|nr:ABC transporter permease subunit [Myxococcales bacterium]